MSWIFLFLNDSYIGNFTLDLWFCSNDLQYLVHNTHLFKFITALRNIRLDTRFIVAGVFFGIGLEKSFKQILREYLYPYEFSINIAVNTVVDTFSLYFFSVSTFKEKCKNFSSILNNKNKSLCNLIESNSRVSHLLWEPYLFVL